MLPRSQPQQEFVANGFLLLPSFVGGELLDRIDADVERLIADAPLPVGTVGQHFYWRPCEQ